MFMNEHLKFDMSVKFGKFLKNNLILKFKRSGDFFFERRKLATLGATTEQF